MNPLLGAEPTLSDSAKTPFKPSVPCENQQQPDLGSVVGPAPARQYPTPGAGKPALQTSLASTPLGPALRDFKGIYDDYLSARKGVLSGRRASVKDLGDVLQRLAVFNRKEYPKAAAALRHEVNGGGG
jgi:hypothetical protein